MYYIEGVPNNTNYALTIDQELMGLQKLYDTQQTLTAELSEKLQMTQVMNPLKVINI